jgi:integrase
MLRIYRRHEKWCKLTSKAKTNCAPKKKGEGRGFCPVWITGVDPDGSVVKPRSLATRNWGLAASMLLEMEAGVKKEAPAVTVEQAIESFKDFKSKVGVDRKRKIKLLTGRLKTFIERRGIFNIPDVKLPDLSAFVASWTDADTTQDTNQQIVKNFFSYCEDSDYIKKNPAKRLDPIKIGRPKTDPFTHEEQIAIFKALSDFPDEYGHKGEPIAAQTKAFVYVLRYTGMAIGDVAKLAKSHVHGLRIRTNRKKTGEDVFAKVPQFVIDALNEAPHDSNQYYFWSGEGLIHTRTSKWGDRLRKLFKLAKVEHATPYMFRHTMARDFLESGGSMAELAELLGNSVRVCEKYYSKWDKRRQDRLEKNIDRMRENDAITQMLNG